MSSTLGRALELGTPHCRLVRTKYRLGESLRVSYEVSPRIGRPLRVSLRGFADGRLATGSAASPTIKCNITQPDIALAEVSALGWIFPNDRKLLSLARFWNDASVRRRALGVETSSLDLMAYAPEKAATIRYKADGRILGFAKLYAEGGARASIDIYQRLGPMASEVGVNIPELAAFDPELGLVALSPAMGETVASRHDAFDWYRLGAAAARLHEVGPSPELPRFERATMARLRTAGQLISEARPDVMPLVGQLLDALDRAQDRFEPGPDVLLHGDLHGKNVLAADQGLTFIDLDQAAIGPAAAELGSAIAALRYESRAPAFETHLLEGYRRSGPLPSVDTLAWYTAAALLGERALRAVNRVRLAGLAHLPLLLETALKTIEGREQ